MNNHGGVTKSFVVSGGQMRNLEARHDPIVSSGTYLAHNYFSEYQEIWRRQPAVRTVVGFLARNIAQIGLHVFERVSDTDRKRVKDHPLALLLDRPMPIDNKMTRYRLFSDLMHDVGIFDACLWVKVRPEEGKVPGGLLRIPHHMYRPMGDDWIKPDFFRVQGSKGHRDFAPSEVVYVHGYNPVDMRIGVSPIESLRQILAEDWQSNYYREQMWQSGARISGYIQRPVEAPRWKDGAKTRFVEQWDAQYRGLGAGQAETPILEDGMTYIAAGITPQQAQYIDSRKLTKEEVAAAYFIPASQVGLIGGASFASIDAEHRMLYQDALGPWLESIQQDLALQLLTEWEEDVDTKVYLEFNINDKLKGSFEEQASSFSTLVGRPVMTANEGRARLNLPAVDDGEGLVTPLNVLIGGQPNPQNPLEEPNPTAETVLPVAELDGEPSQASRAISTKAQANADDTDTLEAVLIRFFERQEKSVVPKVGGKSADGVKADAGIFDEDRWNRELEADLFPILVTMGASAGRKALGSIGGDPESFDEERTMPWILKHASGVAAGINGYTKFGILEALKADSPLDAIKHLFEVAKTSRAKQNANTETTAMAGFGTHEAIHQTGKKGKKTWVVESPRPRKSHKRLDGETVGLDELFSNGARWPGDSTLKAEERARCSCDMKIELED